MLIRGAGFILVNSKNQFLGLIGPDESQIKNSGIFDIPKGIKEDTESIWECAVRECFEETKIKINKENLVGRNYYQDAHLTLWLARTDESPVIEPNPANGRLEHQGWQWMPPKELYNKSYRHLQPAISWAIGEMISEL